MSYRSVLRGLSALPAILLLTACAHRPLNPWTAESPPLALVPVADAGVDDQRGRFREILCAVLESRGEEWPDYRSCEEALTRVGEEPPGPGKLVDLGPSQQEYLVLLVPGVGWECAAEWLTVEVPITELLVTFGYGTRILQVDGLSSSGHNAQQIRDGILALPDDLDELPILLLGYSKGTADILEAVVSFPEIRERIVAVLSLAGSVGGSPLANFAKQKDLNIMRFFPGAKCSEGDGGAIDSLRPATRRAWLAKNPLPEEIAYYSLVTYPHPDRISTVLSGMYRQLSQVDARNDSQMIYYDQIIPGSTLLGFLNADHWAVALPIQRSHRFVGATFVDRNDYPREAVIESVLRFVAEDLEEGDSSSLEQ